MLDRLAQWGLTGLWLIGLWERSPASKRIKRLCGNPEAEASAYSLLDYRIAEDLGGEEALRDLRQRARERGIRLAADMVPNHMGIDSRWVMEHPDWFLQLDQSPFPGYSFEGPDLSWDERVGIYLEDHYYDGSDAAVVFKRVDRRSDDVRYIYHGNDGTAMPWNDTAQLNYLLPEVREAVLDTILRVAGAFSVIRFDAAMTLAKKHFKRLWFPEPGEGGAIPTRAEYGLTREEFEQAFPVEFWRMVVDRVAEEAPDTLLLAEAFWLMEGYFVRTLGMHRVYNSAFMNMLRDERNQEYRLTIKNTIAFDPEILKRYVNFVNNPDERTAVDQFGKGDKYFGICTMMVTMPGLPMFGHGQIEGYAEKYGMEFRRAYWQEKPDRALIERHEREIFPLLRKRHLFAHVDDFYLYDFQTDEGYIDEDVFAYSNRRGQERALIIYHNSYSETAGWIRTSVGYRRRGVERDEEALAKTILAEGLGLPDSDIDYVVFRDQGGLEYIRNCHELYEQGLYVSLGAYQKHVFLDFRQVKSDHDGLYARLTRELGGRGVSSIDAEIQRLQLEPLTDSFAALFAPSRLRRLAAVSESLSEEAIGRLIDDLEEDLARFLERAVDQLDDAPDPGALDRLLAEIRDDLARVAGAWTQGDDPVLDGLQDLLVLDPVSTWALLLACLTTYKLGKLAGEDDWIARSRQWFTDWQLRCVVKEILEGLGQEETAAARYGALVGILIEYANWWQKESAAISLVEHWLIDEEVRRFVGIHRWEDVLWFDKESFEKFLRWMRAIALVDLALAESWAEDEVKAHKRYCCTTIAKIERALPLSEYKVDKLLEVLNK